MNKQAIEKLAALLMRAVDDYVDDRLANHIAISHDGDVTYDNAEANLESAIAAALSEAFGEQAAKSCETCNHAKYVPSQRDPLCRIGAAHECRKDGLWKFYTRRSCDNCRAVDEPEGCKALESRACWAPRIHSAQTRGRCERDSCEVCLGAKGGVRGNENVIDGVVMCDYCHSAHVKEESIPARSCETCEHGERSGHLDWLCKLGGHIAPLRTGCTNWTPRPSSLSSGAPCLSCDWYGDCARFAAVAGGGSGCSDHTPRKPPTVTVPLYLSPPTPQPSVDLLDACEAIAVKCDGQPVDVETAALVRALRRYYAVGTSHTACGDCGRIEACRRVIGLCEKELGERLTEAGACDAAHFVDRVINTARATEKELRVERDNAKEDLDTANAALDAVHKQLAERGAVLRATVEGIVGHSLDVSDDWLGGGPAMASRLRSRERHYRADAAKLAEDRQRAWDRELESADKLDTAERERDEARANARILAHAYEHDTRPPQNVVEQAMGYPVVGARNA